MAVIPDYLSTLIIKLLKKEASESEKIQIEEWASQSEENRKWLIRFFDFDWLFAQTQVFQEIKYEKLKRESWKGIQQQKSKKRSFARIPRIVKVAAIFFGVGVFGVVGYYIYNQTQSPTKQVVRAERAETLTLITPIKTDSSSNASGANYISYSTFNKQHGFSKNRFNEVPVGSIAENKPLPDESNFWLNANSSIEYPPAFYGTARNVRVSGEAYFEVSKKYKQPFQVVVNGITIETLNGHFNVTAYKEDGVTKVTAVKGRLTILSGPESVEISSGQSVTARKKCPLIIDEKENVDQVIDWIKGDFIFNNDSLSSVVRELSRYYSLTIPTQKWTDLPITFTGKRSMTAWEAVTGINSSNKSVHLEISGNQLFETKATSQVINSIPH